MDFEIKAGNKKIIDSGSFIIFGKNLTTIIIKKGSEKFSFDFIFEDVSGEKQQIKIDSKKYEKENHAQIILKFINFNDAIGSGLTEPLEVGYFDNGDKIFLHLWVQKLGGSDRKVSYTFYLEKKNG